MDDGLIEGDGDAYEMLANSWIASREYDRSLPPLKQAAELSEDGTPLRAARAGLPAA